MSGSSGAQPSDLRGAARAVALAEELGAQLRRLKGAGPKVRQLLSMVQLDRAGSDEQSGSALGGLPEGARAVAFKGVRKVIEQDLDARVGKLFDDIEEEPFALSSLGQVHRAQTADGDAVAVKVQRPGGAEAVEADLRNLGLIAPIIKGLAPGVDAGVLLAEIRERVAEELDYEVEAQHQRRLERMFRGHPHVRLARVHTELSGRRVLVTEYVEGRAAGHIAQADEAERDRLGEIVFRFFFGLAWRDGIVAGDPHPDNLIVWPDGRIGLLDFGLSRDLDGAYLDGERDIMSAIAAGDRQRVHDGLSSLGYLGDPAAFDPGAVFEFLAAAGEWLLTAGSLRVDSEYVERTLELGYPPRSPYFALMRRMSVPASTLLLRRMEVQVLAVLGALRASGDWAAISAEHHSGAPVSTALGREDVAFHQRRG